MSSTSDLGRPEPSSLGRGVVFISHEKTDYRLAREIRQHLEAGGFGCWMSPDDIRGPAPWPEQISRGIDSCDVMLIVVSASSSDSPHVSREVDIAVEKAKPLLPVRVEDIAPTGSLDYLLRLAQWIDLFPGSVSDHATSLQGMVGSMLGDRGLAPAATPPVAPVERRRQRVPRRVMAVLAGAALVVVGVTIGVALTRDDAPPDEVETIAPGENEPDEGQSPTGSESEPAADDPGPEEPVEPAQPASDGPAEPGPAPAEESTISRVSVASAGTPGDDHSANPVISADGRYVAFDSLASNLVEGDSGTWRDVFVHDRETGETTRVSRIVGDDGAIEEANGSSHHPRISADGRYVLFVSDATNIVPEFDDTNNASDIFLWDRDSGLIQLVSLAPDGSQHTLNSIDPSMSDDGTLIAYATTPEDATPPFGILGSWTYMTWVFDAVEGTTAALGDVGPAGAIGHDYWPPIVSRNATVVLSSGAGGSGAIDVVVFERESRQIVTIPDLQNVVFFRLLPSPDGERIVFPSQADWLVPEDLNGATDTFAYDRRTGQFELVVEADHEDFFAPPESISADGRYLALADNDQSILLIDAMGDSSTSIAGLTIDNMTGSFELNGDGGWATFSSPSDGLVDADSNGKQDVFVIQLQD